MRTPRALVSIIVLGVAAWLVARCGLALQTWNFTPATPTSTPAPTATFTPVPIPTLLRNPDTGWQALRPGLERRVMSVFDAQGQWVESLFILRLDPAYFRFDVAFDPFGKLLETWRLDTGALIVVNGGYFSEDGGRYFPNGLTVVNGQMMGATYAGYGGMFAVTENGPELRWLPQRPYTYGEPLLAALQSFPILVKPGGEIGFPRQYEDYQQARRTVVAQDANGRILFMVANQGYFTLHQLSQYLVDSDLNLEIALNLDGGPSSGILLAKPRQEIPAFNYLPVVITVFER